MTTFIGVDLGWCGKPSGLALICLTDTGLCLRTVTRLEDPDDVLRWIESQAGKDNSVVAVDAPLVIHNPISIRPAERELNSDFRRFHAGCHAANLSRPFAPRVLSFSRGLSALGFLHGAGMRPKEAGRFQIEVHPHAATVNLFDLSRIVKYKRGRRAQKATELRRLRKLMISRFPLMNPRLQLDLPPIPQVGNLKPVEDQIDAVLCAYVAAYWWSWGNERNRRYGTSDEGYIVVPNRHHSTRTGTDEGSAAKV
jgi:predicted RNase H-like nuclease